MRAGQVDGAVEGDDGLAGAGGAGDAGGAVVAPFDHCALGGVEEDGPFLPGVVEGALQLVDVLHDTKTALRVGMFEGLGVRLDRSRNGRSAPGRQLQEGFGRLFGQVFDKLKQCVLAGVTHVVQPLAGHPVIEELLVGDSGQGWWTCRWFLLHLYIDRNLDLFDSLAHFDQLRGAGFWVHLQPAAPRPAVGLIVVIDIAEQQAPLCAMDDDADAGADPRRPEIWIARPVHAVELEAGPRRVHLQVKGGCLDRFLFIPVQPAQAVGEGVSDAEKHDCGG